LFAADFFDRVDDLPRCTGEASSNRNPAFMKAPWRRLPIEGVCAIFLRRRRLIAVSDLAVDFEQSGRISRAVDSVDLEIASGEAPGIVGESGSASSRR